jgi:hypothetical protein
MDLRGISWRGGVREKRNVWRKEGIMKIKGMREVGVSRKRKSKNESIYEKNF